MNSDGVCRLVGGGKHCLHLLGSSWIIFSCYRSRRNKLRILHPHSHELFWRQLTPGCNFKHQQLQACLETRIQCYVRRGRYVTLITSHTSETVCVHELRGAAPSLRSRQSFGYSTNYVPLWNPMFHYRVHKTRHWLPSWPKWIQSTP
jgi:hypothetical protein